MPLPPHLDPLGISEPASTLYRLTVCVPPRPPPRWLPSFFTRTPVTHPNTGSSYILPPSGDPNKPKYDCCELKDLDDLPTKAITLKSAGFPPDMRCEHIDEEPRKFGCDQGCYFLEKGGDKVSRWFCKREDCEGHVYCGRVKKDAEGKACFGKKGERMICLDRSE